jgi:hypothetical protein
MPEGRRNEMSDTETDLAVIGGILDGNGEEVPGEHPIENPGPPEEGARSDDPLSEPRPDEPGVRSNGDAGPTENPGE